MVDILKIDNVDKQILRYLTQDARKPYTEIAKELFVSPGTIHVRVKKLEQMGIIKGTSLSLSAMWSFSGFRVRSNFGGKGT